MDRSIMRHFRPLPTLKTERLKLRRAYLTDTDDLFICMNNPNVCKYEAWNTHSSIIDTLGYVNNLILKYDKKTCTEWIIEDISDERAIGMINIHDLSDRNKTAEMGFWLAQDCWNKGYASEAARKVLQFAFEQTELNKIICMSAILNYASQNVIQKLGMKYEGTLRQHILVKNEYTDIKVYSMLRYEFYNSYLSES